MAETSINGDSPEPVANGASYHAQPRVMDGIVVWDALECDAAFRAIPHRDEKPTASLADQVRL
jgi:hypothetical protein